MLILKQLLLAAGWALLAFGVWLVIHDLYCAAQARRAAPEDAPPAPARPVRWRTSASVAGLAFLPLAAGDALQVVPSGSAGVRVSQFAGTRPGAYYPGTHTVLPLVERLELYSIRDTVFTTGMAEDPKKRLEVLRVQTREGLSVGLAIAVRYRLDPRRLDHIHADLPPALAEEIVQPVVMSVFRQVVPNYMVRELFATRREEVRRAAHDAIAARLASDGIVVQEVMVRDIALPEQYARGLEGLLLKAQENERLTLDLEVKQKLVRTAELEAEAQKARQVKAAEAQAQVVVLQAKAQADAMQHTLPLKEKQIQQTRLESEARKEATVKNAEAAAQAKVIDSRAELERRKLLAEAEDHRIRLVAGADAERMKTEALALKQNPLLIQKIIAERLSDKVQIMMVPTDGRFFFANDVLRGGGGLMPLGAPPAAASSPDEPHR